MKASAPTPRAMSPILRLFWSMLALTILVLAAGLLLGSLGHDGPWLLELQLITELRAPRTLGAWLAGACLGLAGALAQGVFRNPLADPYLLGSAAGAGLGVTLMLALGSWTGTILAALPAWTYALSLSSAAFVGALAGVSSTLLLARGAANSLRVLLAGMVVGVLAAALSDALAFLGPSEIWRDRQAFMLGSTSFLSWQSVLWLALSLVTSLLLTLPGGRILDALTLGESTARSLGMPVARWRAAIIAGMALCTGTVVAHAGMIAFVGLAAPHLIRQRVQTTHRPLLLLASLAGGILLAMADVLSRSVAAPRELPVGLITAVLGGIYWLVLMHRQTRP
jgi:iron complex transport system permease protein